MPLALPTLASEIPGNYVTSALWNNNVYNGLTFAYNQPMFQGYQTATQAIASATLTALAIDTTVVDFYNGHSNVTNNSRYVAQQSGYYLVIASAGYSTLNATGNRVLEVQKNGSTINLAVTVGLAPTTSNGAANQCATIVQMNGTTDYVEAYVYQTSGSSLTTAGASTGMSVIWLHA